MISTPSDQLPTIPTQRRQNYLNNRDMLLGIHHSKSSYSRFSLPEYHQYDIILPSIEKINIRTVAAAKRARAKRIGEAMYYEKRSMGERIKMSECIPHYTKIPKTDLIFRIMTFNHIPKNSDRKKTPKRPSDYHELVNFPPFQHWKFDEDGALICVGKSHWDGDVHAGCFSKTSGRITHKLGEMILKICERYATRGNIQGYCVDDQTYALTQRGWLSYQDITVDDFILSSTNDILTWSPIKSIYTGTYTGLMHHLTGHGIDALITPNHKMLTLNGLRQVESLVSTDDIVAMSSPPTILNDNPYSNEYLQLIGYLLNRSTLIVLYSDGQTIIKIPRGYDIQVRSISIALSRCQFPINITQEESYDIITVDDPTIGQLLNDSESMVKFASTLSEERNEFLLNYIVRQDNKLRVFYSSPIKSYIDLVQILFTFSGLHTQYSQDDNSHTISIKPTSAYGSIPFSKIDFNGGVNPLTQEITPTTPYDGMIWCPETHYGCFVAKRNNNVYITGNTYNDEMCGQAIVQLTQICLQFDESQSSNPFSYFTAAIKNSFVRGINLEKRNQNIRDDILEKNDMEPSFTRTCAREHAAALKRYGVTEVSTKELLARAAKRQAGTKTA